MPIKNRLADMHAEIAEWRRDLHQHPEIMYETRRTASLVAKKLTEFGCDEVVEGIGRTGVVGLIKGRSNTSGRVIGLRADMDALPMQEATGLQYASATPGAMHACGHDGHTAMLLGAAKYLAETRNFDGAVAVIFQPAEEGGAGGRAMVEDGLIERFTISEVYGMHNSPGLPVGAFAIRPGPFYAATDTLHDHNRRRGRARGQAACHDRPDRHRLSSRTRAADDRLAQHGPDALDRRLGHELPHRVGRLQRDPRAVELRGTVRTFDKDLRATAEGRG